jgi:hypothetical protein
MTLRYPRNADVSHAAERAARYRLQQISYADGLLYRQDDAGHKVRNDVLQTQANANTDRSSEDHKRAEIDAQRLQPYEQGTKKKRIRSKAAERGLLSFGDRKVPQQSREENLLAELGCGNQKKEEYAHLDQNRGVISRPPTFKKE